MSSRRRVMIAAGRGRSGDISPVFGDAVFSTAEIAELVDVDPVECSGGCSFSVLIDDYASADYDVCGVHLINQWSQLWLQHRDFGNLEVETIDGSEEFHSDEVEDGVPHHIIAVATPDRIRVYVDGELIGERPGRYFYGDGTIRRVGAQTGVRNFRVWNRVLTEEEITEVWKIDGGN